MESLAHYPFFVFVLTFVFLSIATMAGASLHRRYPTVTADHKEDLGVILAAALTLLALIIGFSFAWPRTATMSARGLRKRRPARPVLK